MNCDIMQKYLENVNLMMSDIYENDILTQMPRILDILLIDRTTSTDQVPHNIIWANDNYIEYGSISYMAKAQIKPELITGARGTLIKPRALKTISLQKIRTRTKAEVFTPTWIVKNQNDAVEENYKNDDLETYIKRKWLEITCGEAPYMATRYVMETGEIIPIVDRVGFVDRKLSRINREVTDQEEWQRLAEQAYKASYGFEWNGDSLLLARENLLYTYLDYFVEKWQELPLYDSFEKIAEIISYNVFQMDGLTYTIPLSGKKEQVQSVQLLVFEMNEPPKVKWKTCPGIRVKIMNWDKCKMEYFDKEIK